MTQSCLDSGDELQLCDVIDGTDLPEEWGEENLELDGTNDVEWAIEANKRGRASPNEKFVDCCTYPINRKSRRAMWQSYARTKKDRLDWTKQAMCLSHNTPDSWTVLSDDY
ncbi:hypothetical protein FVEG_15659 [Fusarium verticillioides 7600]|uniref:Uncharacterized protein n=1 Tax=Gibberella moniliformis (strain M3125 / FGSC 7600) TaxID=334819 RepID=W7MA69_GIBM7|nr:hypothetical protein FVEG_15659 [Fusarium verticillioides 7600]EWG44455.1 hypothetical protein FVEG_15659 [Fusarium verticillioides 7600]